ncbi:MAG: precorrin-4 C(11)-methyltransferase [Desulfovibrio sp.]|nr:precorrin-4 C(11)-methyltransferase [Desulfovibrio sp.]
MQTQGFVSFIGAGPGDPELITVKGAKRLQQADRIIYAGSLVPQALLPAHIPAIDSAPLTLEAIIALMEETTRQGGMVARLHTGDPSLYGALQEECASLRQANIPFEVIPGVTAACAAAAKAAISFTIPGATQTLILTRLAGRTPMPKEEDIRLLASHKSALAVYLAGKQASLLQQQLEEVLPEDTPILIAHKVGHPEEALHWTRLQNLAACVGKHHMERQSVILILPHSNHGNARSKLYDPAFSHGFRS